MTKFLDKLRKTDAQRKTQKIKQGKIRCIYCGGMLNVVEEKEDHILLKCVDCLKHSALY